MTSMKASPSANTALWSPNAPTPGSANGSPSPSSARSRSATGSSSVARITACRRRTPVPPSTGPTLPVERTSSRALDVSSVRVPARSRAGSAVRGKRRKEGFMSPKTRLSFLPLIALLAVPAASQAQPVRGTVIGADRSHHVLRVVESKSAVQSLRYSGRLPRKVRSGSIVQVCARGHRGSRIRYLGRASRVQFLGRVVAAARGKVLLSLPDGRPFAIDQTGRRTHAAGNVSVNVQGLEPGASVLITVTFSSGGDVTIAIEVVAPPPPPPSTDNGGAGGTSDGGDPGSNDGSGDGSGDGPKCGDPDATDGQVLGVNRRDGSFTIRQGWGDSHTYSAGADLLARIHETDQALAHFGPAQPSTATDVRVIKSTAGSTPDPTVQVADGVVNWTSSDAGQFGVVQTNGEGHLTFDASCWVLNQVWTSEDVHVIYHADPSGDLVVDTVDAGDGSEL